MSENMEAMSNEAMDADINSEWDGAETPAQPEPQAEGKPVEEPTAQQPSEPVADQPTTPELFTLKNRDETRQVNRDQLIAMAQKGWDYDTVRQERDQLRQYKQEAAPALEVIKGYAQRNNMTVPDYLDFCRKQELMRGGLSEKDAQTKLGMEKERRELDARQAVVQAKEQQQTSAVRRAQEAAQARQRDIVDFCKAYPDVKAESIPKEVWAQVAQGTSLTNAYTMHENKRLAAELAAERQNKANQARTTGSLGGNSGAEMDEIDRLWSEDD